MAAVFSLMSAANAATFTVDSPLDQPDTLATPGTCRTAANTCTLRAAIMQASRSSGIGATIMIPAGTYKLTIPIASSDDNEAGGDLNIAAPITGAPVVTIIGAGPALTIIDATQIARAIHVHSKRIASISQLSIINGYSVAAASPLSFGGAIFNEGTLDLVNVELRQNQSGSAGGGIFNVGTITLTDSKVIDNSAQGVGGGVFNTQGGKATLINSTISGNKGVAGGGIANYGSTLIKATTISANVANDVGGGIFSAKLPDGLGGDVQAVNTTISGNTTKSVNGFGGGGLFVGDKGVANIYNVTIAFNHADGAFPNLGGGVQNFPTGTLNIRNTLIAGNDANKGTVQNDCVGTIGSYGRNLVSTAAGCTIVAASAGNWTTLTGTIGPLQGNGGPTATHALIPASNAIDGGDPVQGCVDGGSATITTDQRGLPRVSGARCDIGAFEYTPARIDVDGNKTTDALTDGLLILRYLFNLTGPALVDGAVAADATRKSAESIAQYLDGLRPQLDVDASGQIDALSDGLMIVRYLFGIRGDLLVAGATGPASTRTTPQIESYIQGLQ